MYVAIDDPGGSFWPSVEHVRLESLNGHYVDLAVSGYQFASGQSRSEQVDWDANWLMIRAKVWDGDQSWEFHDPCMTTWESRELASWLRGLGDGNPATVAATDREEPQLWFTEPNLMFTLNGASQGVTTLHIYFNAESRPPSGSNDDAEGLGHQVRLVIPQADIAAAVSGWEDELTRFPVR